MKQKIKFYFNILALFMAGQGLLLALPTQSQPLNISKQRGLPKGATMELVHQYESPLPGFTKIHVIRFIIQPNTQIKNYSVPENHFCYVIQGEVKVTLKDGMQLRVKAGDEMVEPKGRVYPLLENTGNRPYIEVIFELVEKKSKTQKSTRKKVSIMGPF